MLKFLKLDLSYFMWANWYVKILETRSELLYVGELVC
jgi:hypothetical protein